MTKEISLLLRFILVIGEILLIAYLDYVKATDYVSLDVFYCLPVVQAARLGAIHAMRRTDSQAPIVIAIVAAVAWSIAEAAIIWPAFPLNAFALNVFTRSVTFTVVGRVVAKLWKEREHGRKDVLTNLANRSEFFEKFEIEQLRSERSGNPYSLLYIDIDNFKMLNDTQGHHVGDEALKMLSDILRQNSRRVDTVSRFGGDEFVLLVPETDKPSCEMVVSRINLATENAFQNHGWPISLSIGRVTETGKKRSADEILREADAKMYSVKSDKQ